MDRKSFAIDRIEEGIVILENIDTKEKKEVDRVKLPDNIKEGSIVNFINDCYILDWNVEEKRRQEILEKFLKLRKNT